MLSRMAAACTVLTSFRMNGTQTRFIVIACMIVQAMINTVSVLQLVLQCGPHPYRPVSMAGLLETSHMLTHDKTRPIDYSIFIICGILYRLMTRSNANHPLCKQTFLTSKEVGSSCNEPSLCQLTNIGVNAVMDFCLAAAVVFDLWIMASHIFKQHQGMPIWSRLRRVRRTVRFSQLWLLLALSGPLVFAGAASIVKIYVSNIRQVSLYHANNLRNSKISNSTLPVSF